MKLFKVKTFIADPTTLDYRCFCMAVMSFLIGSVWLILAIYFAWVGDTGGSTGATFWTLAGMSFVCFGVVICVLREFIYHNEAEHHELTKRLAEQEARIRKLEAQLTTLIQPTPTP